MSRPFKREAERKKPRSIALDDETWRKLKAIARIQKLSVSAIVAEAAANKIRRWKLQEEELA